MSNYFSKIAIVFVALAAIQAEAQQLKLGLPSYGGTGCPGGSASTNLSPDGSALSILFDSYVVESGGNTGKRLDRKSCNVSIPVQVPNGYSVAVFQVDYRGFTSIPRGGRAQLDAEYFWAGVRGPRITRAFTSSISDVYTVTDNLIASTLVWSQCGASVNLRANTSMMVTTNSRSEQALATVDSADVTSGLIYHLQFRRCN